MASTAFVSSGRPRPALATPLGGTLYRRVWRWHFYAALFVLPLMVVLSLSGALYLFKPQVERWEERAFHHLPTDHPASPSAQVGAARAAFPGARFQYYRLPERDGDAAMVHMVLAGGAVRDIFVSPQGRVLGSLDPAGRIIAIDRRIHGQLLIGRQGSWVVELAASWAIVLILSGLYLWWPRGRGAAGVLWPRLARGGRVFWRDLHAVTGFWVSALAMVLLVTGLPWADAWGNAFKAVRHEMGWVKGPQDWTIGGLPAGDGAAMGHDHGAMMAGMGAMAGMPGMAMPPAPAANPALLDSVARQARAQALAFPVLVVPPGAPAGEGGSGKPAHDWTVRSDAQDRPLRTTLHYDRADGHLLWRDRFADHHPIDIVVGYGVAWHEGQLFGWVNQLIGLATALMLVTLAVSGFVLWWRRKPEGALGAPPPLRVPRPLGWGVRGAIVLLMALLPLFALSMLALLLVDGLLLPRLRAL
jgi:uncharacterized iron-regulated membrane protein